MRERIISTMFIVLGLAGSDGFAQELDFKFVTTKENVVASRALIDKPQLNGNPHLIIIATPLGDAEKLNPHPIGAWYYQEKWHIFNTDHATMSARLEYRLRIFLGGPNEGQILLHRVAVENQVANGSAITANRDPTTSVSILQNHKADGNMLNPNRAHAVFDASIQKWVIKNINGAALLPGTVYNVVFGLDAVNGVITPAPTPTKLPGDVVSNTKTPGTTPTPPAGGGPNTTSGGNGANNNTFTGVGAGQSNTTGSSNSFFGTDAGSSNKTGIQNTFAGWGAGSSNTSGQRNSFFGAGAGGSNATGRDNTLIGGGASAGKSDLIYATALGADAAVYTSNTVALGRPEDTVLVPGFMMLANLGVGGSGHVCRNNLLQISLCSSSLRYKTNITTFHPGLSVIRQLRPIAFDWKAGGMKDVGFGAEDVARIDPLFVTYNSAGEVEGVKYDRLSAVFVNAFNEQQLQIETQAKQIADQQRMIEALRALVCRGNMSAAVCGRK